MYILGFPYWRDGRSSPQQPKIILIDVKYSQNATFSFKKFSIRQNHSSSGSHHLVKKSPQQCSLLFDTKCNSKCANDINTEWAIPRKNFAFFTLPLKIPYP